MWRGCMPLFETFQRKQAVTLHSRPHRRPSPPLRRVCCDRHRLHRQRRRGRVRAGVSEQRRHQPRQPHALRARGLPRPRIHQGGPHIQSRLSELEPARKLTCNMCLVLPPPARLVPIVHTLSHRRAHVHALAMPPLPYLRLCWTSSETAPPWMRPKCTRWDSARTPCK